MQKWIIFPCQRFLGKHFSPVSTMGPHPGQTGRKQQVLQLTFFPRKQKQKKSAGPSLARSPRRFQIGLHMALKERKVGPKWFQTGWKGSRQRNSRRGACVNIFLGVSPGAVGGATEPKTSTKYPPGATTKAPTDPQVAFPKPR